MKTPKLIVGTIAVLLFSNLLIAGDHQASYMKDLASNLLNNLSKDIALTDSQKVIIQTKANEYQVKMKDLNKQSNKAIKEALKKEAFLNYSVVFDSVLTQEQRDTLMLKQMARTSVEINEFKTKNNNKK